MSIEIICREVVGLIEVADSVESLEKIRIQELGKSGRFTAMMKELAGLNTEEKKARGQSLNKAKQEILKAIEAKKNNLEENWLNQRLHREELDLSLPILLPEQTGLHPITQAISEISSIFSQMGFSIERGPEIEDDHHNFTALNVDPLHPARQLMDTFYLPGTRDGHALLLRTQTSPVQIRAMRSGKPPFRLLAPGRVFRSDYDATHTPVFHQVEGLVIDEGIHMGHLKACILEFCHRFFEVEDMPLRFRPSYFPFTEPSAEVDIGCSFEGGKLHISHNKNWLEILGCGMVHPNVLRACGLDPEHHQGFAFGIGVERVAILKYGIPDLRLMYESDVRWLQHFNFDILGR